MYLLSDSLQLHPELLKYDKLYQSVEQSELLNQKESRPMLGFGLDYVAVSERPDLNFSDNGKDIVDAHGHSYPFLFSIKSTSLKPSKMN